MKTDELQISIVTRKMINGGEKMRQIISVVHNVPENGIPEAYRAGLPALTVFHTGSDKLSGLVLIYQKEGRAQVERVRLASGSVYHENRWQSILPSLTRAKERLINSFKRRKDLEQEWSGEETFDI